MGNAKNPRMVKYTRSLMREHRMREPSLPDKMIWTASALRTFRTCRRKFFWRYVMRLGLEGINPNLVFGSAVHDALADWYCGKRTSMAKIAERYTKKLLEMTQQDTALQDQGDFDKWNQLLATFRGMMVGYSEVYAQDKKRWNVTRENVEREFFVDFGDYAFAGKVDLIVSDKDGPLLVEHKTASQVGQSYIERLVLDTQIRSYVFGAVYGLGIKATRVLYDVVRKCMLRRKANESQASFDRRIADDYASRPDFYYFREKLPVKRHSVDAFREELQQTHDEYVHIITTRDWRDPRSWTINDGACIDYQRLCPFFPLDTIGLDPGTGLMYDQRSVMHEELAEIPQEETR